ncbi:hypothetical protein [Aeromonas allosaccharophila]|uniref:hypothetical protein n=1 Tax=Aeromonas allosaccharophila TaxID=656 RepID=UPI000B2504F5|nr:hypothetical protein [Aeromonas allosaccharophila]
MSQDEIMIYDKNNSKRIYNLFVLKGKCLDYSEKHIESVCQSRDLPCIFNRSDFFGDMSCAIDDLLLYFLNDEVSASLENRGPLGDIINQALNIHKKPEDAKLIELAFHDVQNLFMNRTDFMIGSYFLSFTVNSFSVFEKWVCNLYGEIKGRTPPTNKKENELIKLIQKYNSAKESEKENILNAIMKNCSSFVSSSEMIEFCLSRLTSAYDRNKENDMSLVRLYRDKRNTIHNLGIHKKKSVSPINIKGINIELNEGMPSFTEDFNSNIYMCEELVEIYAAMLRDLKPVEDKSLLEWSPI